MTGDDNEGYKSVGPSLELSSSPLILCSCNSSKCMTFWRFYTDRYFSDVPIEQNLINSDLFVYGFTIKSANAHIRDCIFQWS